MNSTRPPARWAAVLAATALNATRLAAGARLADGQASRSLTLEAELSLADARTVSGLPPEWMLGQRLNTVGDVAAIELRDNGELVAVLKLSRSTWGDRSLRAQERSLHRLADDARLARWHRFLPDVLAHGLVRSRVYSIERAVPGTVGASISGGNGTQDLFLNAVAVIGELHQATGRAAVASGPLIDGWLEPGLSLVAEVPAPFGGADRADLVDRLRNLLHARLEGRTVWISRTHGDYFPGNIFHDPSGSIGGIIDWAQSREDDPALIDPMTLVLADRIGGRRTGLGGVVRELCGGAPLSAEQMSLLEVHRRGCPADPIPVEVMALLAWLRHVENNLLKSWRYAAHPVWVHRNVTPVLKAAGRLEAGVPAPS